MGDTEILREIADRLESIDKRLAKADQPEPELAPDTSWIEFERGT